MDIDRARLVHVIKAVRDAVLVELTSGQPGHVRQVDPQGCELVQRACAELDVALDEWLAALHADPELVRLFHEALDELVIEAPDPGPYDAISRESPSGSEEADREAFDRDARLLGRTGR
jgi:hypothetical protein